MDPLGALNAFMHAATNRSFTAAGRALGISSSAVGKAISRLEMRHGVRLFHRSTRSITLTPEGELFLNRCRAIFREIEAAESELAQSASAVHGTLRVSLPLIGMLMTPVIAAFSAAHPEIRLDLDFTDRLVDVVDEGFDVVMRTGDLADSRLKARNLGNFSYVIVGAPEYFGQRGVPETPEELVNHACLYHRWPSSGKLQRWEFSRDGVEIEFEPPASTIASTMEPLIGLAERGLGLMYTPIFTVRRQLSDGKLRSVLGPFLRSVGTLQILWPPSRHPSPKLRAFVDFMASHLLASQP
jgi:DNA-binding transcriptional LysR family regulator